MYNNAYNSFIDSIIPFTNPGASVDIITDAESLVVSLYSNIYSANSSLANITVRCNGINQKVFATANATIQDKIITLPSGTKTVTMLNGLQSGTTNIGTFIYGVAVLNKTISILTPTTKQRIIAFIGDSVANGYLTTDASVNRYATVLQDNYPQHGFIVEGSAGISLNQLNTADANGTNTITRLKNAGVTDIVFAIGLNDYGQSVSLATHESQLTAWVNTAKSLYATSKIYVQSLSWSTETTAINGNLPSAFRTVQQSVATNTGVNFIDGTTRFSQVNMADGSHPNGTGHIEFANNNAISLSL